MSVDHSAELLRTKLSLPPLPRSLIHRRNLLIRLSSGLEHKLTVVSAPAGSGKTTLISQWLNTYSEELRAGWLALDARDNDPARYWRYVIAACQTFAPEVGKTAMARLNHIQSPNFSALLTTLVNDLTALEAQNVLVVEDYHCITSTAIHEAMTFLLDYLPPSLHLIVITRGECPLPLARLRVRGELNELNADDLSLVESEIAAFFQDILSIYLEPDSLSTFVAQTEGWAASLRLAALALQTQRNRQGVNDFLANFSGKHQHIADYLADEVLTTANTAL